MKTERLTFAIDDTRRVSALAMWIEQAIRSS